MGSALRQVKIIVIIVIGKGRKNARFVMEMVRSDINTEMMSIFMLIPTTRCKMVYKQSTFFRGWILEKN